jgi:hypothetical protein
LFDFDLHYLLTNGIGARHEIEKKIGFYSLFITLPPLSSDPSASRCACLLFNEFIVPPPV